MFFTFISPIPTINPFPIRYHTIINKLTNEKTLPLPPPNSSLNHLTINAFLQSKFCAGGAEKNGKSTTVNGKRRKQGIKEKI